VLVVPWSMAITYWFMIDVLVFMGVS
jgi:hypothetical protein